VSIVSVDLPRGSRNRDQQRRASVAGTFVHSLVVLERADGVCGICGHDVDPFAFHVDHVVPLARGGEHNYSNVQPAHPLCNQRKSARLPEEMD
jgi:5-methylcytosine-specific restriction endonuclease McrA